MSGRLGADLDRIRGLSFLSAEEKWFVTGNEVAAQRVFATAVECQGSKSRMASPLTSSH
jgi:hypothetical protein